VRPRYKLLACASVPVYTLRLLMHLRFVEPTPVSVTTDHEGGVFVLGFAHKDSPSALLLMLSDTVDRQDALLGMDTYCISNENGATFYGGVRSARLNRSDLELCLTPEAAEALGVDTDLLLRLPSASAADTTPRRSAPFRHSRHLAREIKGTRLGQCSAISLERRSLVG
jgi:hypothetical protein